MVLTIILTIILSVVGIIAYFWLFNLLKDWVDRKANAIHYEDTDECFSAKQYIGEEHRWEPKYKLEHKGVRTFNIPFVPEENEVFYIENEYDEEANLFILENIDLIREMLATRGLTFTYLPFISVTKEMAVAMLGYYTANQSGEINDDNYEKGLKSNFLLDYMLQPENRPNIEPGFCWFNYTTGIHHGKKLWYTFDYITFDPKEAREHPREVLEDMLPELCTRKIWRSGLHCEVRIPSDGLADDNFDEETKNILADIQEKLNQVRLKGISEAIIARYTRPVPKLSRMTISSDFRIILNDYDDKEIMMEPIVKAVYILFLRHEEGILFKELANYQAELEIIYRAVRARKNDIERKMQSGFAPLISEGVKSLTNPMSNSINEKCTRIKEAFIVHFHDNIAMNYYIRGIRASEKMILLPRKLVTWEEEL